MWNDDSTIEKICETAAGVDGGIVPEVESAADGRLRIEAAGGKTESRRYADGSSLEVVPVKLSLKVKLLSPGDGLRAAASLERVCRRLEHAAPLAPASSHVVGAKLTSGPSKLSSRDGADEYGATVSFYVYRPADFSSPRFYINTGGSGGDVWSLAGRGIFIPDETVEPEYYTRRFIDEACFRRTAVGLSDGLRFRLESEGGGDGAELLRGAARMKKNAEVEILTAFPAGNGTRLMPASRRVYSAAPTGAKHDAERGAYEYELTLWACGEASVGKFDAVSLTFTADGE